MRHIKSFFKVDGLKKMLQERCFNYVLIENSGMMNKR